MATDSSASREAGARRGSRESRNSREEDLYGGDHHQNSPAAYLPDAQQYATYRTRPPAVHSSGPSYGVPPPHGIPTPSRGPPYGSHSYRPPPKGTYPPRPEPQGTNPSGSQPQRAYPPGSQPQETYTHGTHSREAYPSGSRSHGTYPHVPRPPAAHAHDSKRDSASKQLRLVKLTSDILPAHQNVAIVDSSLENISIGRDKVFTPRIRLAAMEVSKHHANVFPLKARRGTDTSFAITDTGSTHGTYVLPYPYTSTSSLPPLSAYDRISPPKQASTPYVLQHQALIRIGQTVFQVHHHVSGWTSSCQDCTLLEDGSNEIALNSKPSSSSANKVKQDRQNLQPNHGGNRKIETEIARREAMKQLRTHHLGTDQGRNNADSQQYMDRAAARRSRIRQGYGAGQDADLEPEVAAPNSRVSHEHVVEHDTIDRSEPVRRLDESNRGFQMFQSMVSGGAQVDMTENPVIARGTEGRAGLGSKRLIDVEELASKPQSSDPYDQDQIRARQRRRYEDAH